MIKIFQIYFEEEHKEKLCDNFIPYFNEKKSIFVENQCFVDIRQKKLIEDADYVGALSYKFHDKVIHKPTYEDMTNCIESNPDGDIFSPKLENYKMIYGIKKKVPEHILEARIRKFHYYISPNQMNMRMKALPLLWDMAELGIIKQKSIPFWGARVDNPVYCNFWIASKDVFIDYADNFLTKTMSLIESYEKDNWLFTLDKKYPHPPPKDWVKETNFETYPIVTFIMERIINLYILDRQLNHKNCL
jgi:hypothetical protein